MPNQLLNVDLIPFLYKVQDDKGLYARVGNQFWYELQTQSNMHVHMYRRMCCACVHATAIMVSRCR